MCGGVAAHQFDPESAHAVQRDVQREQPSVTELESTVNEDEDHENQYIPQ